MRRLRGLRFLVGSGPFGVTLLRLPVGLGSGPSGTGVLSFACVSKTSFDLHAPNVLCPRTWRLWPMEFMHGCFYTLYVPGTDRLAWPAVPGVGDDAARGRFMLCQGWASAALARRRFSEALRVVQRDGDGFSGALQVFKDLPALFRCGAGLARALGAISKDFTHLHQACGRFSDALRDLQRICGRFSEPSMPARGLKTLFRGAAAPAGNF